MPGAGQPKYGNFPRSFRLAEQVRNSVLDPSTGFPPSFRGAALRRKAWSSVRRRVQSPNDGYTRPSPPLDHHVAPESGCMLHFSSLSSLFSVFPLDSLFPLSSLLSSRSFFAIPQRGTRSPRLCQHSALRSIACFISALRWVRPYNASKYDT